MVNKLPQLPLRAQIARAGVVRDMLGRRRTARGADARVDDRDAQLAIERACGHG